MCVLSIKVPIRKKSGNLFNDPRIYIYIYIYIHTHTYIYIWTLYLLDETLPIIIFINNFNKYFI